MWVSRCDCISTVCPYSKAILFFDSHFYTCTKLTAHNILRWMRMHFDGLLCYSLSHTNGCCTCGNVKAELSMRTVQVHTYMQQNHSSLMAIYAICTNVLCVEFNARAMINSLPFSFCIFLFVCCVRACVFVSVYEFNTWADFYFHSYTSNGCNSN